MAFLCTGCAVLRGHMDVKERACTGCAVFRGHINVKNDDVYHLISALSSKRLCKLPW